MLIIPTHTVQIVTYWKIFVHLFMFVVFYYVIGARNEKPAATAGFQNYNATAYKICWLTLN